MKIKTFFILSVVFHVLLLVGIYFLPTPKSDNKEEFVTTLVFPEELNKPEEVPRLIPQPTKRPRMAPPVQKRREIPSKEKPEVPGRGRKTGKPLPEGISPEKRREIPSKEKPEVPGRGRKTGKPLPEGISPEKGPPESSKERTEEAGRVKPGYDEWAKIFDRDIISSTAKKDFQGSSKESDRDKTITFNTAEYRYTGYMSKLKERIESIWMYPLEARMKGIYGDLRIRFTIKKNGRLQGVELVRTSGYKMLDDAALKALKDGEPYWPLPEEWGMESYTIHGHFIYNMYGYYVR